MKNMVRNVTYIHPINRYIYLFIVASLKNLKYIKKLQFFMSNRR